MTNYKGKDISEFEEDREFSEVNVRKVNEVYHDIINEYYDEAHPTILTGEKERWINSIEYFNSKEPLKILDIGTGTGFVPMTIAGSLKEEDEFICLDVSSKMLKLTEEKIRSSNFKCSFKFINKKIYELSDNSIDVITIDSVLHHIKDIEDFLLNVDRILKDKGILIIGHEPNNRFRNNKELVRKTFYYNLIHNTKNTIWRLFKKIHLNKLLEIPFYIISKRYRNKIKKERLIATEINKILLRDSIIDRCLSLREIEKIVEIRAESGLDPFNILPGYEKLYFETYNHLSEDLTMNYQTKEIQETFKKRFPNDGATFFMILKK